jgi:hypothetical protein
MLWGYAPRRLSTRFATPSAHNTYRAERIHCTSLHRCEITYVPRLPHPYRILYQIAGEQLPAAGWAYADQSSTRSRSTTPAKETGRLRKLAIRLTVPLKGRRQLAGKT